MINNKLIPIAERNNGGIDNSRANNSRADSSKANNSDRGIGTAKKVRLNIIVHKNGTKTFIPINF